MNLFEIDTDEAFSGENLVCDCDTLVPVEAGYHVGLLERERLHVVTQQGDYTAWTFDPVTRQLSHVRSSSAASVMHR